MTAAGQVRERLVVKRQRCSAHGLVEHALLFQEAPLGRRSASSGRAIAGRSRRRLLRVVCLECDPREFMRLQAQYRR